MEQGVVKAEAREAELVAATGAARGVVMWVVASLGEEAQVVW